MIKIAVLIVTFNSSTVLKKALECLSHQTLQANKILIVDNGSHDLDRVEEEAKKNSTCEVLSLQVNTGFAKANNIGIDRLKNYDFIALLNPDAYPKTDWLEKLVLAAHNYPDYGFFGSMQLQEDECIIDGTGDCLSFTGQPFRRDYSKKASTVSRSSEPIFSACAAAALYRTHVLIEAGGFDEDFFCYVEDIDLGFRLQLLGYPCWFVSDAKVIHLGSTSTGKRSSFSIYYGQRNVVFNFFKNMPIMLLTILIIPFFISSFIYLCYGLLMGKGKIIFKAKLDGIKEIESIIKKRKIVQEKRKVSTIYILKLLSFKKI